MTRLILSILAGIFIGALLSTGVDYVFHVLEMYPPYGEPMLDSGLLLLAFAYRAVFTVLAAYLTAVLAKDRAKKAVWILGIINSLAWLGGSVAMWEYAAAWYNIAGIVTGIPLCLLGGKLYELRVQKNLSQSKP